MHWKQIADQLHDALRDLYENGANCPDDKVLRARDAYDAACAQLSDEGAQDNQCLSAEDAAEQWLRSTARLAGPHGVSEEQEHLMRLGYENGYRDAKANGMQDTRVEELERTVEAYRRALDEAIAESPTRLRASPMPWASCAEWVNNRVAELLKEKENG